MADLGGRYAAYTARLVDRVLTAPGETPSDLRRAVLAQAARLGGGRDPAAGLTSGEAVPAALGTYVDKVARHAHKVTDEDVTALQRAGTSDDALFEVTVSAALGAALGRLERGLAALRGEPRSVSERDEER
jgi:alkylhydroperoxidase family enzyme